MGYARASRPRLSADTPVHPEGAWYELLSISLEIPVELFCTKLMFLSNFSLHFFEIDASTKLVFGVFFLMQSILLFGGEVKQSQISMCIFFIWVFLGLDFPLWHSVCAFHPADPAGALTCSPPFMSHSTFVTTQIEQHDLELFNAACTFCKIK